MSPTYQRVQRAVQTVINRWADLATGWREGRWAVELTLQEVSQAAIVGVLRQCSALRTFTWEWANYPVDRWNMQVEGACGEYAFAIMLRVLWPAAIQRGGPDVAHSEVRTSAGRRKLYVKPSDPDDRPVVSIHGSCRRFRAVGWILAGDAKVGPPRDLFGDGQPMWEYAGELRPMDELLPHLDAHFPGWRDEAGYGCRMTREEA
jgi:hypothetical protein